MRNATDHRGPSDEIEDHFTITRIESGKLWLESFMSGEREIGPVPMPQEVTRRFRQGWDISGIVVKTSFPFLEV